MQTRVAIVVGGLQDGVEMLRWAGLCQDSYTGQAALFTGKMQRGISSKVSELRITASFQKCLSDSWLASDHSQVEWSLLQVVLEVEEGQVSLHLSNHFHGQSLLFVDDC